MKDDVALRHRSAAPGLGQVRPRSGRLVHQKSPSLPTPPHWRCVATGAADTAQTIDTLSEDIPDTLPAMLPPSSPAHMAVAPVRTPPANRETTHGEGRPEEQS
ncbi:hypothetical protein GCM10011505_00080 [Tistrella bauzanensis]|uniref:Uncharacterized protein n=1 Tax=Tistrella bauzanensis TaxID=657419 RepID=A0ABQ1I837_9PROT|nr:hypothetical protein GCM10011505_00080 [Tistrella bauzanensis]